MNREELTAELRRLLELARENGVVLIALIANERESGIRIVHNVISDKNAGDIMSAVAPILARGEA